MQDRLNRHPVADGICLGIDSSTRGLGVALTAGTDILAQHSQSMERGQAEHLLPAVQALMQTAGVAYGDVQAIGAVSGPGAFTGIRIALAAAKGLALAYRLPALGHTTFDVLAEEVRRSLNVVPAPSAEPVLVIAAVESRRTDLFLHAYSLTLPTEAEGWQLSAIGAGRAVAPAQTGTWLAGLPRSPRVIVTGDAVERFAETLADIDLAGWPPFSRCASLPDPAVIGFLTAARLARAAHYPAEPVYLRAADAKPAPPSRIWPAAPQPVNPEPVSPEPALPDTARSHR